MQDKMNPTEQINNFIETVLHVHEIEYGDFKRKMGLYINRLEQNMQTSTPQARAFFDMLREKVIYNPLGEIESTRSFIIEESTKFRSQNLKS